MKTAFSLSDLHFPYQDSSLLRTSCSIMEDLRPETVVLNGDIWDLEQVSKYHNNAFKGKLVQEHVAACHESVLNQIFSSAGEAKIVFICGNHENRIERFFDLYLEPFGGSDYINVQEFLLLGDAHEFIPYMGHYELCPGTYVTHGHYLSTQPGATVRKHMESYPGNVIVGHSHRIGYHSRAQATGGHSRGWEMGHMTDNKLVPGWKPSQNWQKSAGVIVRYDDSGEFVEIDVLSVLGKNEDLVMVEGEGYNVKR